MKNVWGVVIFIAFVVATNTFAARQQGATAGGGAPPPWAYPVNPPPVQGAPPAAPAEDPNTPKRIPGTDVVFPLAMTRDLFNPPDWFPAEHPQMPEVVAKGRKPDVRACGYCHLPNGQGRPENANLAGLPAAYIVQQMADYKNGVRKSSEPRMGPPNLMIMIAKSATDAEVSAAAQYFSSLKAKPWIKVTESATAPKTRVQVGMPVAIEDAPKEPIGNRIIEVPENLERTELRDPKSGFVAYVPVGSIKKGEALVTTGGAGKTVQCSICHGSDLKGIGPVPALAGRGPIYITRQLYDIQHGNRKGVWSDLMKAAVAKLSEEDMVAIAAYLSSRMP